MRYVEIAGSDKKLSVLGLGTAGRGFTLDTYDRSAGMLNRFIEAGGNCIDTAHFYGSGESEKTLGRWIWETGRRSEIFLITKGCHPGVDPQDIFGKPWEPRLTPKAIRADLSESLERLQTDYVDLYLLHRDDETVTVGPIIEALDQEQTRGRIRAFGASNWRVERVAEANEYAAEHELSGFVISSPSLSLARPVKVYYPGTQFADDLTRQWHHACQFPLLAWASLAAGFMDGNFKPNEQSNEYVTQVYYSEENFERLRRAQELGARKNATSLQIGLAYVLQQAFPTVALVGPSTITNLNELLGGLEVELDREEMDFLDLKS